MHIIDSASISAFVAGKLTSNFSQGTSLYNSAYIASRIFLPFILIILAYAIENGATLNEFMFYSMLHLLPTSILIILIIVNINFFQKFFQRIIFFREDKTLPEAVIFSIFSKKHNKKLITFTEKFSINKIALKKVLVSSLAYVFLSSGFFISFSISYYFEEFRMTISQLTTVFHGLGQILLAFFIDPMLSRSIDCKDENLWKSNLYSIMFGRLLAYLVVIFMSLIIFLNIEN